MEKLAQGTKIKFDNGVIKGTGKVVGLATSEQPVIGYSYIIEPDDSISNEVYPYSHFVCFGIHLEKIT